MAAADPDTADRQRDCGVVPVMDEIGVRVKDETAYYTGLETCSSVWLCPVCSAKIRFRRAGELRKGMTAWCAEGHSATLITLTVPHDAGDPLALLLGVERDGWHRITAGSPYKRLKERIGIRGFTISTEITHGRNGWHPHFHVLFWHDEDIDAHGIGAIFTHMWDRWVQACRRGGLRDPDPVHGIDIRPNVGGGALAGYLAKVQDDWSAAEEMARGDLKTGRQDGSRMPFQILADYYASGNAGDKEVSGDRELWREYARATRGLAAVRWSRGLRKAVFPPDEQAEATDEELAAADVGGQEVAVVSHQVWCRIRGAGLDLAVLVAAERGGLAAVNEVLAVNGCGWARAPAQEVKCPPRGSSS